MKKIFDKYLTIWEKVSNIIKKINNELIYKKYLKKYKKYLKAEKRFNTKESYIPVILFDSVYKKEGNHYPKMFLEKILRNFSWRNIRNFGLGGSESSS